MNWLNDVIVNIQNKLLADGHAGVEENAAMSKRSEKESVERLHQFQSRLADLDRRILELR